MASKREVPMENRASEQLANECTFLAWVRTTIALISLGFVLARLGPWLTESGKERGAPGHESLAGQHWPRYFWGAAHSVGSLALRSSVPGD